MKKTSEAIHRNHAEQKAVRDAERSRSGYKGKSQSIGPSKKQENPLTNPFAQLLAFAIRAHNRQAQSKPRKAYEHRKR